MPYKLSCSLISHVADVRGLALLSSGDGIISASRDGSAKLWTKRNGNYVNSLTFTDHSHYVTCATSLPPSENHRHGLIATGSNDSTINIYSPTSPNALIVLVGHSGNVTSLRTVSQFEIASSSCDGSCKVWRIFEGAHETYTAPGHTLPFWDVLYMHRGFIIAASADKSILVFDKDSLGIARILKGHDDCVRGLCSVGDKEFLSCSNDGMIIQWNVTTGLIVQKLAGHLNFIYSVTASPSGLVASAGEDGFVYVWNNRSFETISHPSQTVWCVAILPNDDIVTGGSDGVVRIFTKDPSRVASEDTVKTYEALVTSARQSITSCGVDFLEASNLLEQPGTYEDEIKFIRDDQRVSCHSWNSSTERWVKLGEFPAPMKTSDKPSVDNNFDYVFNVDIEEGMPPLKLRYNSGDNPRAVAQAFIAMHDLPPYYCEQIIDFIIANTNSNDFTRQGAEATELNSKLKMQKSFFPRLNFFLIEVASFDKIKSKVKQFAQTEHSEDVVDSIMSLTNPEVEPSDVTIEEFFKMLQWPSSHIFPILDIARLAVLNDKSNRILCHSNNGSKLMHILKTHLTQDDNDVNAMLSLRTIANMAAHESGQNILLEHADDICRILVSRAEFKHKKAQLALSAFLLNLSILCYLKKDADKMSEIQKTIETLIRGLTEDDALFFALVALGSAQSLTKQPFFEETITLLENVTPLGNSEKVVACSKQILDLISPKSGTNPAGDEICNNTN